MISNNTLQTFVLVQVRLVKLTLAQNYGVPNSNHSTVEMISKKISLTYFTVRLYKCSLVWHKTTYTDEMWEQICYSRNRFLNELVSHYHHIMYIKLISGQHIATSVRHLVKNEIIDVVMVFETSLFNNINFIWNTITSVKHSMRDGLSGVVLIR